jgi:uncharacterized membrane protein
VSDTVLFNVTLRPNPPMSAAGLKLTLAVVAAMNLAFAIWFVMRGAWPVTPFMGLDVALLGFAFHVSRVAARRREELRVTPNLLSLDRIPPRGAPTHIEFNPYWVQVDWEEQPPKPGLLTLRSHGRAEPVGSFLAPEEKRNVASALRAAIGRARATPIPSG